MLHGVSLYATAWMCNYAAIYILHAKLALAMAVKQASVGYEYTCYSELVSESYVTNLRG